MFHNLLACVVVCVRVDNMHVWALDVHFSNSTAAMTWQPGELNLVKAKVATEQLLYVLGIAGIWPRPPDGALSLAFCYLLHFLFILFVFFFRGVVPGMSTLLLFLLLTSAVPPLGVHSVYTHNCNRCDAPVMCRHIARMAPVRCPFQLHTHNVHRTDIVPQLPICARERWWGSHPMVCIVVIESRSDVVMITLSTLHAQLVVLAAAHLLSWMVGLLSPWLPVL